MFSISDWNTLISCGFGFRDPQCERSYTKTVVALYVKFEFIAALPRYTFLAAAVKLIVTAEYFSFSLFRFQLNPGYPAHPTEALRYNFSNNIKRCAHCCPGSVLKSSLAMILNTVVDVK